MFNFLTNHYDIFAEKPDIHQLPSPLENLAKQLYDKGLLRISTVAEYNFCLFPFLNGEKYISFSKREVEDKNLIKRTKKIIANNLSNKEKEDKKNSVNFKLALIKDKATILMMHQFLLAVAATRFLIPKNLIMSLMVKNLEIGFVLF